MNISILQYLEAVVLDSSLQSYPKYAVQNNLNSLKQPVEYKLHSQYKHSCLNKCLQL